MAASELHHLNPCCAHIYTSRYAYLGLQVRLLNSVADNLTVAVVFGRLPLQRGVETPDIRDKHRDGRTGLVCQVCERKRQNKIELERIRCKNCEQDRLVRQSLKCLAQV